MARTETSVLGDFVADLLPLRVADEVPRLRGETPSAFIVDHRLAMIATELEVVNVAGTPRRSKP